MLVDPNSELLKQLTRIADAANRPSPSPWLEWVKTLASFVAGLGTAYVSQQLQGWNSDRREQTLMRRIVYMELARGFIEWESLLQEHVKPTGELILTGMRMRINSNLCTFTGEAYMKEHPTTFYQLEEGVLLTHIYIWFHRLDPDSEIDPPGKHGYGLVQLKGPVAFFSDYYRKYPAIRKHLKRFVSASEFKYIDAATKRYRHVYTAEEMQDSGMLTLIPIKQDGEDATPPNLSSRK